MSFVPVNSYAVFFDFSFIELSLCLGVSEVEGKNLFCQYCSGAANENNKLQHATDDSVTEEIHLFTNKLQLNCE